MSKLLQVAVVFLATLLLLLSLFPQKDSENLLFVNPYNPPIQDFQHLQDESQPQIPITVEPKFENYPAVRQPESSLGKVLSDIECHMPAGHIYRDSDKITWGHETSHGLASNIRQKFSRGNGAWRTVGGKPSYVSFARINGFYVLDNRAV